MSYKADIPLHPGITLEQFLETVNLSQKHFAEKVGMSAKTINQIIKGKAPITCETAIKFERVTGIPAEIWNKLEKAYQEDCVRLNVNLELKQQEGLLSNFSCYSQLMKLGFVKDTRKPTERVESLLKFLGIASLELYLKTYNNFKTYNINYRASDKYTFSKENLMCWLKAGEKEAEKIEVGKYSKKNLINIIPELKKLTENQETIDFAAIQKILASAGIRFVMIEHFKEVPVNGSTRVFLKKPLIQISTRGKKIDSIWFTLFHELGHVYHGHDGRIDLNDEYKGSKEETLANDFASEHLVPSEEIMTLVKEDMITIEDIKSCAKRNGIGVNIVAGRIAHMFSQKKNNLYPVIEKYKLRPSLK